jgi:hypothetical protein
VGEIFDSQIPIFNEFSMTKFSVRPFEKKLIHRNLIGNWKLKIVN